MRLQCSRSSRAFQRSGTAAFLLAWLSRSRTLSDAADRSYKAQFPAALLHQRAKEECKTRRDWLWRSGRMGAGPNGGKLYAAGAMRSLLLVRYTDANAGAGNGYIHVAHVVWVYALPLCLGSQPRLDRRVALQSTWDANHHTLARIPHSGARRLFAAEKMLMCRIVSASGRSAYQDAMQHAAWHCLSHFDG